MPFLDDRQHQDINCDTDPDLCLDGVRRGAGECLDAKVLPDPFKEELDLSALMINCGRRFCRNGEVVGNKHMVTLGVGG